MDHLQQLGNQLRQHVILLICLGNVLLGGFWWAAVTYTSLDPLWILVASLLLGVAMAIAIAHTITPFVLQPVRALWQAVLHLSPSQQGVPAPKVNELRLGRELVASLTTQIYQLADVADHAAAAGKAEAMDISRNFIAQNLPLPMFVLDSEETVLFANDAAAKYIGIPAADLVGKNVYMVLDMSFPSEDTFDRWLKDAKQHSATATSSWERVRLTVRDNHPTLLFDLAAYYNRDNSQHHSTLLVLFDHTKQYSQDEQAVSFIALTVHELRTPLTLLRGYIEALDDELSGKVDDEMKDFILKMRTMAEQLMAFVNNILNVARIDNDQLELHLQEASWQTVLQGIIETVNLRAKVRGITIELQVAPDLPAVAVDNLSIREVINNLVDNAIKYSGDSRVIKIDAHLSQEGVIETTVQDFGLGISASIMPNLFTKFYRDHRNRAQIGGTGLGLYLSKAIIEAHGGNLWVRSKEGEGSTFGFTLQPYAQLTDELKRSGNQELVRTAHGWIKNHSLYRH
jgi:signal transduction histidine kinase